MRVTELILGLFVFSGIMLGMGYYFTGMAEQYGYSSPSLEAYGNTSSLNSMVGDMAEPLQEGQLSFEDTPFIILNTAWTAITLPFRTIAITSAAISKAASEIVYFPTWVIDFLKGIILLVIVTSILMAATKVNI